MIPGFWISAATSLLLVTTAHAQVLSPPPPPTSEDARKADAQQLRDAAVSAWERGEYLAALENFRKAYAVYPTPNLRFNIARVLVDLGRDVEAIEEYEGFLDAETNAPVEARRLAETQVQLIERRLGRIEITAKRPGADIMLDGNLLGRSPLSRTVRVNAGVHQVSGLRTGFAPALVRVTVAPQATAIANLTFGESITRKWWFWTAVGAGAAALATGVSLAAVYGPPRDPMPSLGSVPVGVER